MRGRSAPVLNRRGSYPSQLTLLRRIVALALPAAVWAATTDVPLLRQGVLFLAPFFIVLALWSAGVDPEPLIARLRSEPRLRAEKSLRPRLLRGPRTINSRLGDLLAALLAGRAPPRACAAPVS